MDTETPECSYVFTLWWYRAMMLAMLAMPLIGGVVLAGLPSTDGGGRVFGVVVSVLAGLVFVRGRNTARIDVNNDGVVFHTFFRRRHFDWSAIEDASIVPGASMAFVQWRVPTLNLRDGISVPHQEIRSRSEEGIADQVVDAINQFTTPSSVGHAD